VQAASLGGGRILVTQLDGIAVNFTGEYNTLLVRNQDEYGAVAAVTGQLSRMRINVANMSLCRRSRGSEALMVIETDHKLRPLQVDTLRRLGPVLSVTYYEKEEEADA
jgi:L-serine dehydratase